MRKHFLWSILWNLAMDQKHKWFCKIFWNTEILNGFKNIPGITVREIWEAREEILNRVSKHD